MKEVSSKVKGLSVKVTIAAVLFIIATAVVLLMASSSVTFAQGDCRDGSIQCLPPFVCSESGVCEMPPEPDCTTDEQCSNCEICLSDGTCGGGCPRGHICDANNSCVNDPTFCRPRCNAAIGEFCMDNQCVQDPCFNVSCGAGQFCRDGQCLCTDDRGCSGSQICDINTNMCVATPTLPTGGRVAVEFVFSGAGFTNTLSLVSSSASVIRNGCELAPAGGLDGVRLLSGSSSREVSRPGCIVQLDADSGQPGVQPFTAGTTLEFLLCAQRDTDRNCEDIFSTNPANNSDNFNHVRTTISNGPFGPILRLAFEDLRGGGDMDFDDLIVLVRVEGPAAFCDGLRATIFGTPSDDSIDGTPNRDVVVGLGGDDTINGFGGSDIVCGGDGVDTINGDDGNDRLFGGRNRNIMNGGEGDDVLYGREGNDTMNGDGGSDRLFGQNGDDDLNGGMGAGTDFCKGGMGNNTFVGCEVQENP